MAANTTPIFTLTPNVGTGTVSTANTNRDGTGTIVDIFTAGAAGSKVNRMVAKATGDPADSTLTFYFKDAGGTYWIFDEWDIGDPAAGSTTVASYREERGYSDLVIPTSCKIGAAITVALTAGSFKMTVWGGDY